MEDSILVEKAMLERDPNHFIRSHLHAKLRDLLYESDEGVKLFNETLPLRIALYENMVKPYCMGSFELDEFNNCYSYNFTDKAIKYGIIKSREDYLEKLRLAYMNAKYE